MSDMKEDLAERNLAERVNWLHCLVQELEDKGVELPMGDYTDVYGVLEDAREALSLDVEALDAINLLLSAPEWPGASGMEDVRDIVRSTGREEIPNAPEWERH